MCTTCSVCNLPAGSREGIVGNPLITHGACAMEQCGKSSDLAVNEFYQRVYEQACATRARQIGEGHGL